ncbi:MAG: thiamine phosphate synthase [Acidobacteria bacterium]|nr:thiamine phosphate synthase [Acidobacteriota bacterium]MBV9624841.1 thiamine phosphate synthase [Acidobacteriota bacterium]
MLLYYISDRTQFPGNEARRREQLLEKIAETARAGIDFVQLREKDLPTRELEALSRQAAAKIRFPAGRSRLLINSRVDVALAAGADGVHLRSGDISAREARGVWHQANGPGEPIIAVSCHNRHEVLAAAAAGADYAVFGPVFEKPGAAVQVHGLELLASACRLGIPVLALGGVTVEKAASCIRAGAHGVAGIRLFQQGNAADVAARLRGRQPSDRCL